MDWLEVSLVVDGELAESVADVLARYAPNGVVAEQAASQDGADAEGRPEGPITVRAYLPIDGQTDVRRRKIEESLHYLGMIRPVPDPLFRLVPDQNWMEAWKRRYAPITIGRRLIILPAWMDADEPGRIPVKINPGMAFGTGTHPSTQLCLELLENWFAQHADPESTEVVGGPDPFVDIGCGSAILCFAALKLGARSALGIDTDAEALRNARENAKANGVGSELVLAEGSVREIRHGEFPWAAGPLVAVNILAPVIVSLFEAGLAEVVAQGGCIILGGMLEHQADSVITAAQAHGLTLVERRQMADWVALAMQRKSSATQASSGA